MYYPGATLPTDENEHLLGYDHTNRSVFNQYIDSKSLGSFQGILRRNRVGGSWGYFAEESGTRCGASNDFTAGKTASISARGCKGTVLSWGDDK